MSLLVVSIKFIPFNHLSKALSFIIAVCLLQAIKLLWLWSQIHPAEHGNIYLLLFLVTLDHPGTILFLLFVSPIDMVINQLEVIFFLVEQAIGLSVLTL